VAAYLLSLLPLIHVGFFGLKYLAGPSIKVGALGFGPYNNKLGGGGPKDENMARCSGWLFFSSSLVSLLKKKWRSGGSKTVYVRV
jgi:hypothetical protein